MILTYLHRIVTAWQHDSDTQQLPQLTAKGVPKHSPTVSAFETTQRFSRARACFCEEPCPPIVPSDNCQLAISDVKPAAAALWSFLSLLLSKSRVARSSSVDLRARQSPSFLTHLRVLTYHQALHNESLAASTLSPVMANYIFGNCRHSNMIPTTVRIDGHQYHRESFRNARPSRPRYSQASHSRAYWC